MVGNCLGPESGPLIKVIVTLMVSARFATSGLRKTAIFGKKCGVLYFVYDVTNKMCPFRIFITHVIKLV